MKNSKIKSAISVIISIVFIIAAAVVIGWAFNNAIGPWNRQPEKNEPTYTMKVNEATGAEEYYDEDGQLSYQVKKEYADDEKKQVSREIYADAENKTTKVVYYQDDGKTVSRVDEWNGDNVSVQHIYENGVDTKEYWKYEYDEAGRQTSSVNYNAENKAVLKKATTFNEKGKPTLYVETNENGDVIARTEYNYDKDGKETKTVFYNAEGIVGYVEYEYDKDGNVTRMNEYKDGNLIKYITYKFKDGVCTEDVRMEYSYDSEGRKIREEEFKAGKSKGYTSYTYDKDGKCKEAFHKNEEK